MPRWAGERAGIFKKTTLALAVATFALCNFAAFVTRSGFFSSLHAFNQSPLGWMFLLLMAGTALAGGSLLLWRAIDFAERPLAGLSARESWIWIFMLLLVLLAATTLGGTLVAPVSGMFLGQQFSSMRRSTTPCCIPLGAILLAATGLVAAAALGRIAADGATTGSTARRRGSLRRRRTRVRARRRHPAALAVAALVRFWRRDDYCLADDRRCAIVRPARFGGGWRRPFRRIAGNMAAI